MSAKKAIKAESQTLNKASAQERLKAINKVCNTKKTTVIELRVAANDRVDKPLSQDKQWMLVLKYRVKARKLGLSILRRWHARLDLSELESIVDLSLCEAVRRFNPKKGASFMTFLFYHLRGNLIRAVSTAVQQSSIPTGDDFETVNGKGVLQGITATDVAEALCSNDSEMPDEALLRKEIMNRSYSAIARLDPLEKEVIERVFLKEQQLLDVAKGLGYSRCHISRVKRKALDCLFGDLSKEGIVSEAEFKKSLAAA